MAKDGAVVAAIFAPLILAGLCTTTASAHDGRLDAKGCLASTAAITAIAAAALLLRGVVVRHDSIFLSGRSSASIRERCRLIRSLTALKSAWHAGSPYWFRLSLMTIGWVLRRYGDDTDG